MAFGGVSRPFVGRVDVVDRLAAAAGRALRGEPQLVVIRGPAGIGKTALVRRFLGCLDDAEEWRAITVLGAETETTLSYGLLSQLDRRFGALLVDQKVLATPAKVGAGIVECLDEREARGPVCLVVDDAQWADASSVRALQFALQRLDKDRVLTIVALRSDGGSAVEGFGHLADLRGVVIDLDGLGAGDLLAAAAGTGRVLSARVANQLVRHTSGNPLHFWELLSVLADDQLGSTVSVLPAPLSVERVVARRLAGCSASGQRLAAALAVLGSPALLWRAAGVAGIADPSAAADAAISAGLIETFGHAPEVSLGFIHPLYRSAVFSTLPLGERRDLHRCAARLATDEDSIVRHLVAASDGPDPILAARADGRADHHRDRGALVDAAAGYIASAGLQVDGQVEQRRWQAVDCLLRAGDVAGAQAVAADTTEAGPDNAWRSYAQGWLALLSGRQAEAELSLDRAWHLAMPDLPAIASGAATQVGILAFVNNRMQDVSLWAARVADAEARRPNGQADASGLLAITRWHNNAPEEALSSLTWLDEPATSASRDDLTARVARQLIRLWSDDLDGARRDAEVFVERARSDGPSTYTFSSLAYLAETEFRAGNWEAALAHSEQALSLGASCDQTFYSALYAGTATVVYAARGLWERAIPLLAAAEQGAALNGDPASASLAASSRAQLAHARGDYPQVIEALLDVERTAHFLTPGVHPLYDLRLDALIRLGRLAEAEPELAELEDRAARRGRYSTLAVAARLRGKLEAQSGSIHRAHDAFQQAIVYHAAAEMPFEMALTRAAYGGVLRRAGRGRAAIDELEAARAIFTRLDAQPYLAPVAAELAAYGRAAPRPIPSRPDRQLTARELAIARLVTDGYANKEIADQLFVSVKTVEYHMGNAFRKLGVRSRTQLIRTLRPDDA